jgi:hypothetical protein
MLRRLLYTDIKTYLVELLMKQDNMSMVASIEPFKIKAPAFRPPTSSSIAASRILNSSASKREPPLQWSDWGCRRRDCKGGLCSLLYCSVMP